MGRSGGGASVRGLPACVVGVTLGRTRPEVGVACGKGWGGGVGLEGDGRGLWGGLSVHRGWMVILEDFRILVLKWREESRKTWGWGGRGAEHRLSLGPC